MTGRQITREKEAAEETEDWIRGQARLELLCQAAPLSTGLMPISIPSTPSISVALSPFALMTCHVRSWISGWMILPYAKSPAHPSKPHRVPRANEMQFVTHFCLAFISLLPPFMSSSAFPSFSPLFSSVSLHRFYRCLCNYPFLYLRPSLNFYFP